MTSEPSGNPAGGGYSLNREQAFMQDLERRSVVELGFFTQHLRAGMRLLDCGCGPGNVTLEVATCVSPGETVGLDIDEMVIGRARALAAERQVENARFEVGDVRHLPYPDASFDAVFAQFLLFHLPDPLAAIKEMRRVLRPGGVAGIRDGDPTLAFMLPEAELLRERGRIVIRAQEFNGGNSSYGRHQRRLLLEAGFARAEQSAFALAAGTPDMTRRVARSLEAVCRGYAHTAVEQGWIDETRAADIVAEIREWSERPDAFSLQVIFQSVGFVQ